MKKHLTSEINEKLEDKIIFEIEKLNFKNIKTFERSREACQLIGRYKFNDVFLQLFKFENSDRELNDQKADILFETQDNERNEDLVLVIGSKYSSLKIDRYSTSSNCENITFDEGECLFQLQSLVSNYNTNQNDLNDIANSLCQILERGKSTECIKFLENSFKIKSKNIILDNENNNHNIYLFENIFNSISSIIYFDLTSLNIDLIKTSSQRVAYKHLINICDNLYYANSIERPDLALIKSGQKIILLSPHRSKDRKVLFSIERISNEGWIKNALSLFMSNSAPIINESLDIDKILHTRELDRNFHELLHDFRKSLIEDLLNNPNYVQSLTEIINNVDQKKYTRKEFISNIEKDFNLQGLYIAICDGLVLRTIIHRFLEVIHDKPVSIRHDDLLKKYTTQHLNDSATVGLKAKGKTHRLKKSAQANFNTSEAFKLDFLKLDSEYVNKYGGDIHEASISKATRELEEVIGIEYLCELLDLTKEENYNFNYDELRPDALESYYEKSLETSLKFIIENGQVRVEVDKGNLARKDLGAYFTPAEVSRYIIENSLAEKLDFIENEIKKKGFNSLEANLLFEKYINLKIIDPTVGGGSFLKEAFREYCSIKRLNFVNSFIAEVKNEKYNWLKKTGEYEKHVLTKNLYGIDFDYKSLSIASQTLTLESLSVFDVEEKLPILIGKNLKVGNTFVSWIGFHEEWKLFSPGLIEKCLKLRLKSLSSGLEKDFDEENKYKNLIINEHKSKDYEISDLKPFSWQLEFPEIYYNLDGTPKQDFGFDVIVGNPPWECLKPYDEEFASRNFDDVPTGKNSRKLFLKYFQSKLRNKNIENKYNEYMHLKQLSSRYVDASGHYRLLSPLYYNISGGNGDVNTYKLASEIYLANLAPDGVYGIIVPDGICGDKGTRDLRVNFLSCGLEKIISFNKTNDVFPDALQAFAIMCGNKAKKENYFKIYSDLKNKVDLKKITPNLICYPDDIFLNSPLETKPILAIESNEESLLLKKYFKFSSLSSKDCDRLTVYNELHTTSDMHFTNVTKKTGYTVCKGEHMGRFKSPDSDLYSLNFSELKKKKKWFEKLNTIRIAFRDIAGLNDRRRMICSMIPQKMSCFNSLNVISGFQSEDEAYFFVGVLNSMVYEFLIRKQSRNNHINAYLVKLNPIVRFNAKIKLHRSIAKITKKLHINYSLLLEAELEALVACAYDFNIHELKIILNRFDKVDPLYLMKVTELYQESCDILNKKVA